MQKSLSFGGVLPHGISENLDINSGISILLGDADASRVENAISLDLALPEEALSRISSADVLMRVLTEILVKHPDAVIAVEDDLHVVSDSAMSKFPDETWVSAHDTIIHLRRIDSFNSGDELDELLFNSNTGFPMNAFVFEECELIEMQAMLDRVDLIELPGRLLAIVNTAFDSRAFSCWIPYPLAVDLGIVS